jgi:hypothetical protein
MAASQNDTSKPTLHTLAKPNRKIEKERVSKPVLRHSWPEFHRADFYWMAKFRLMVDLLLV